MSRRMQGAAPSNANDLVPKSYADGLAWVNPTFGYAGGLVLYTGQARWYNDTGRALTIANIRITVGTAPTGAAIITDINKNGTTIFTTQANRPTIAISGFTSGKVTNMDITTIADGDYMTVDVDQIGSTVPGSDLSVTIYAK